MLDGNKSAWARPLPSIVAILLLCTCWDVQQATAESPSNSLKNGCEPARRITEAYRIEAVGSGSTRLKESQPPDALADPDGWYSSQVDDVPHVPDGYRNTVVLYKPGNVAWVHRVGGFIWSSKWYGPVSLAAIDVSGCARDPALRSLRMYLRR